MGDFGEKRNSEGYWDPTPYLAIKDMIKPGEIWTFQKKDFTETEVLVVGFGDNIATILHLMDEYKDGCVECVSDSLKWVNPRMINWSWAGYLNKCVRKLSKVEFKQIQEQIEKSLSVKVGCEAVVTGNPNEADSLQQQLDVVRCRLEEAEKRAIALSDELSMTRLEASKHKSQLDLMKSMYSDLMEKFLQRA